MSWSRKYTEKTVGDSEYLASAGVTFGNFLSNCRNRSNVAPGARSTELQFSCTLAMLHYVCRKFCVTFLLRTSIKRLVLDQIACLCGCSVEEVWWKRASLV